MSLNRGLLVLVALLSVCGCGGKTAELEASSNEEPGVEAPSLDPDCPKTPPDLPEPPPASCPNENDAEACAPGPAPERIVTDVDEPVALAASDGEIFWSTSISGLIRRRRADGVTEDITQARDEVTEDRAEITGLTVHRDRLYWAVSPEWGDRGSIIGSMRLPGGEISTLEVTGNVFGIAVDDTHAYFTDFGRGLMVAAVDDSGLVVGPPSQLAGWSNAAGVASIGKLVFWSQQNLDNSIRYLHKDHPRKEQGLVACNQLWPRGLTADAERVYWIGRHISEHLGRVMGQGLTESEPRVLIDARPVEASGSIAGDSGHLYWVESETDIMRMPK